MRYAVNKLKLRSLLPTVLFTVVLIVSSCDKAPIAKFSIEKESYMPGEEVKCTNQTKDGIIYQWFGPFGSTEYTTDFSYPLSHGIEAGEYSITLEAKNKKGSKSSKLTKSFIVNEREGRLVVGIWRDKYYHNNSPVKVFVDDKLIGVVTTFFTGTHLLMCGDTDGLTASLMPGNYQVTANNGISTQSASVNVERDGCVQARFTY